jgi:hypothetical protein
MFAEIIRYFQGTRVDLSQSGNDEIPISGPTCHTGSPQKGDAMSTSHRAQRSVRPGTDRTVQVTGTPRLWPASLAATALIVFAVFQMTTSPLIAVIVALATAAAGVLAGTWIFGTGRSRRTPSHVSAPGRR